VCAELASLRDDLGGRLPRDEDHADRRMLLADRAQDRKSVEPRHEHVEADEVRLQRLYRFERGLTVGRFTDNRQAFVVANESSKRPPDDVVIVCDENAALQSVT